MAGSQRGSWGVEQLPTTLIVYWPGEAPTELEVRAALQEAAGGEIDSLGPPSGDADSIRWADVMRLPAAADHLQLPAPLIAWCEAAKSAPPGYPEPDELSACRWVVGLETMLDVSDPLASLTSLVRLAASMRDDTPVVLDASCMTWHRRTELNEIFLNADVAPPAEVLWVIHAVYGDAVGDEDASDLWLHTHGLWRCGKPELEMLAVPRDRNGPAAGLINDVAEWLLEAAVPEPGEPLEIGSGLRISLQPWQVVVPQLERGLPGSMDDRPDDDGNHTGARAVICAERPRGVFRKHWLWPEDVVRKLSSDEGTVYRSRRATQRQAAVAQATWDELATAFVKLSKATPAPDAKPAAVVLLKAGFVTDSSRGGSDANCEHLWFEVIRFDRHRAQAKLVNQPLDVQELKLGDVRWIERDSISDWCVLSAAGRFEPKDIARLWRMLSELR